MTAAGVSRCDRQSSQVVEAYLEQDMVPPDVVDRVRELQGEGEPAEALQLILDARQPTNSPRRRLAERFLR